MPEDALREQRLESVVEVVHAVLLSLEDADHGRRSSLRDNWARIVSGLRDRLGGVVSYEDESVEELLPESPGAHGFKSEAAFGDAPAPARSESSRSRRSPEAPARDYMPDSLPGQDLSASLAGMLYPDEPVVKKLPDADLMRSDHEHSETRIDREELESLREKVDVLEGENEELRGQVRTLESSMRQSSAIEVDKVLTALAVTDLGAASHEVGDRVCGELSCLVTYFDKTVRDLEKIFNFRMFRIPVRVMKFSDRFSDSLNSGGSIEPYLSSLRYAWQALFNGVLPNLEAWCQQLRECLAPETIEARSRRQNAKVWNFYKDVFHRMHFYDNLTGALRLHVKTELKARQRSLTAKGYPPILLE